MASHSHGLALDNLIGATVVLANGSIAETSETENADLFWALRGAGSSFAIATNYRFQTFPAPEDNLVYNYTFAPFDKTQATSAFDALQTFANTTMPREMNMRLNGNHERESLVGVFHGSRSEFDGIMEPLLASMGVEPTEMNITSLGWIDTLKVYAENGGFLETPLDYDEHETFVSYSFSFFITSPLFQSAADKCSRLVREESYDTRYRWCWPCSQRLLCGLLDGRRE